MDKVEEEEVECTVTELCTYYFAEPESLCGHIMIFSIAAVLLALSLIICPFCIWIVLLFSCFFCLRYRSVNLILWACIIVLWTMGWRMNFGKDLVLQWK